MDGTGSLSNEELYDVFFKKTLNTPFGRQLQDTISFVSGLLGKTTTWPGRDNLRNVINDLSDLGVAATACDYSRVIKSVYKAGFHLATWVAEEANENNLDDLIESVNSVEEKFDRLTRELKRFLDENCG
jgi:hypothetical protein